MNPSNLAAIDFNALHELTDGDHAFEIELISTFIEAGAPLLARINASIVSREISEIRNAVHTLRGSAQSIGGLFLAQICSDMESQARGGTIDWNRDWSGEIKAAFEAIRTSLFELESSAAA